MSISVIIPINNTASYLRQCLDSVLVTNQFTGEVICVNDGSTDESGTILEDYKSRYSNLQIINLPTCQGPSVARNYGLNNAHGDYIYFLDSDDFLFPNALDTMTSVFQESIDVLHFNALKNGVESYYPLEIITDNVTTGFQFVREFRKQIGYAYVVPVWMYCYKRSFLIENNLYFKEGFLHEDEDFTAKVLCVAHRIKHVNQPLLHHRVMREGAITSIITSKLINDLLIICKDLDEYYSQMNVLGEMKEYLFDLCLYTQCCAEDHGIKYEEEIPSKLLLHNAHNPFQRRTAMVYAFSKQMALRYFQGRLIDVQRRWLNRILFFVK